MVIFKIKWHFRIVIKHIMDRVPIGTALTVKGCQFTKLKKKSEENEVPARK